MDPSHGNYGPFMDALDKMSDRCREAAAQEGAAFADVNHLHEGVEKAMIADFGKDKAKFSGDGVHDFPIGHFLMFAAALDGFKVADPIADLTRAPIPGLGDGAGAGRFGIISGDSMTQGEYERRRSL